MNTLEQEFNRCALMRYETGNRILKEFINHKKNKSEWFYQIPLASVKALCKNGMFTKEEVIKSFEHNKIFGLRNLGNKGIYLITLRLKLQMTYTPQQKRLISCLTSSGSYWRKL